MKLSAILAPLVAANVSAEVILQTVLAYEQQQADALEHRRQVDAERQARKRERDKSRDVTLRHSDRPLVRDRVAGVEDTNSTTKIEPLSQKQTAASRGVAEFKAKLAPLLDADLLDAFVSVRKAKRAAMTGYAAGLFVADAERCGMSVAEAAKECVRSSWITVKPEYFAGRPRASPQPKPPTAHEIARNLLRTMEQADADPASQVETDRAVVVSLPSRQYG